MATSAGIRYRLLTILLLGIVVSALSLTALVQLLSTSTRQRVDRAKESVKEQVDRLARAPAPHAGPPTVSVIGMRGAAGDPEREPDLVPRVWVEPIRQALRQSNVIAGRFVTATPLPASTLVVAAAPSADGATPVWTAFEVREPPWLRTWQTIVTMLALATAVLVATTVHAIIAVHRDVGALGQALHALTVDLAAPMPKIGVRELMNVATGMARMAENLRRVQNDKENLGRELVAQERLAALGRVVAGVAHEVRNPLASIKLHLELAVEGQELPPHVARSVGQATSEIERLDRLVADLLVVAARSPGPRHPHSVHALLQARRDRMLPWLRERGVDVAVSGEATAEVNTDTMIRVVDNVLRNAVEASPPNEVVSVAIQTAGDGRITVDVTDYGAGVEPHRVPELFEPFFTTKPDGTGLGLALSRAIARAHQGDLTYQRTATATRFRLTFPARAATDTTA